MLCLVIVLIVIIKWERSLKCKLLFKYLKSCLYVKEIIINLVWWL